MITVHDRGTTRTRDSRTGLTGRRPISDVFRELRDEMLLLVRQEIALARTEISHKFSKIGRNIAYLAVGAAIGLLGLVFLLLAATAGVLVALIEGGMQTNVALWLAPLIVGVVVAIVGYIFVQKAISTLKRESPVPKRTMHSLKEDQQWLKRSIRT